MLYVKTNSRKNIIIDHNNLINNYYNSKSTIQSLREQLYELGLNIELEIYKCPICFRRFSYRETIIIIENLKYVKEFNKFFFSKIL